MRRMLLLVLLSSCGPFPRPVDGMYTFTDCTGRAITFEVRDEELIEPDEVCDSSEIMSSVFEAEIELEVECISTDVEPDVGTYFITNYFRATVPVEGIDSTAMVTQTLRHEIFAGTPDVPDDADLDCTTDVRYEPPPE